MEKRTLIAVLLTMVIWVGWFWYFSPEQDQNKKGITQEQVQDTTGVKEIAGEKPQTPVKPSTAVFSGVSKNLKEETVVLKTGKFNFELQNRGASIKKANYTDRNIELALNERMFNSNGTIDFAMHFSEDDFLNGNSLNTDLWDYQKIDEYTVKFFTEISYEGSPLRIEKLYKFTDKGYDFTVEYKFINRGKQPFKFKGDEAIFSPSDTLGPRLDYNNRNNHMMGLYSIADDFETVMKGGGFFSKPGEIKKEPGSVDYTGIMSRYFLLIMMPQQFSPKGMIFDNRDHHGYRTGMTVGMEEIAPNSELVKSFRIYLGEKDKEMLGAVDQKLIDASDVSTLIEPIRYFVIWSLMWINKLFNNLGWSLVVFSILTKIVFMPLTKKSTDSMKKMQELAPEVKKLQVKYKDKPDVLQKETMKLYKDNKVNPMGGCLPLLLQMPFFFALYSALINSIDLWNAPFMLWMKDLSMPDTVATISGFDINILPLLMTVSTVIQQKQTMVDTGNQQQKIMMYMMPVIMLFIFWTMPSGLVLYWFLQNLYQILNQVVVNKIGKKA